MQLKSVFYFSSVVAVALGATVQDVLNDLNTIRIRMTTLDNAIKAFPDPRGSSAAAMGIHIDITNVQSAVDDTTPDVTFIPAPLSFTDGQSLLTSVQGIEPIIIDALNHIIAKKAAFQALPISSIPVLIKEDLSDLRRSTSALQGALIASDPPSLVPHATATRNAIDAAFAAAIAAYN